MTGLARASPPRPLVVSPSGPGGRSYRHSLRLRREGRNPLHWATASEEGEVDCDRVLPPPCASSFYGPGRPVPSSHNFWSAHAIRFASGPPTPTPATAFWAK